MKKTQLVAIARTYGCASLLGVDNAKTVKGEELGYLTGILYLMPTDALCPSSRIAGCREACLVTAGRAAFTPGIGAARAGRTAFWEADQANFMRLLVLEITALVKRAIKEGKLACVRLNGTSDIDWSRVICPDTGLTLFELFPDCQFYDYTKQPSIIRKAQAVANWNVTASYSGANAHYADQITAAARQYGANLSVVFSGPLPETFLGLQVINGDEHDLRFLDPKHCVVGLKAKGQAKRDTSGFVIIQTVSIG